MKKPIHGKRILVVVSVCVLIAAALGYGYYLGFSRGSEVTKNIIIQGVTDPQKNDSSVSFQEFWNVWNILKSKYVSKDTVGDNQKLLFGAINGLVDSLNDPYTVFFPPKEAKSFSDEISGQFGGIGAEIGLNKQNQLVIIAPLKDTPAERAGLQAGDRITRIDDLDTAGLLPEEAVQHIRGREGTQVTLTVIHNEKEGEKKVTITRAIIQIPTLDFKMINNQGKEDLHGSIAYIKLYNFYEKAPQLFQQAAVKSILLGAKSIILDLRNNPGGYLDGAQSIAGWFLPNGTKVVTEAFQDPSQSQSLFSEGPGVLSSKPIVIIINKGSASASEILAGALQDNKKAVIVGEKSFGKGTVQELLPLEQGMIKVTIAHWLTPNGNMIDKNGITPDISVAESTSTASSTEDVWLQAAIKALHN
ncbi:MAG: S41 family peptidase [Patescibacteria group bacterium]|nr:S41 family peptidase [Patescibacteria group bacterium]